MVPSNWEKVFETSFQHRAEIVREEEAVKICQMGQQLFRED